MITGRRQIYLLFVGDCIALAASLYLTLWLRFGTVPTITTLAPYELPFLILFIVWTLVFYSAGLYGKRAALLPSQLPDVLFKTQLFNILLAAIFFFLLPSFGIAPKTILALYLIISFGLLYIWRLTLYPFLSRRRSREQAILLVQGPEADELYAEVNNNPRYGIEFCAREPGHSHANIRITDAPAIPSPAEHNASYAAGQTISFEEMYEEVFDRIPLSRLAQSWFGDNVAKSDTIGYVIAKRAFDIVGGILMVMVTIILIPFVCIANRIEGSGPLFLQQERLGRHGERVIVYKFRSMQKDIPASGEWTHEGENRVTRVGAFLRKTSLDEFPQGINVLKGEISLIGPRSDIRGLGERLAEALPYYNERYRVTPGITGWAQINQQYEQGNVSPQSVAETRMRLAYDFYYLKHRSFGLDLIIALKTIKKMFFRVSVW